MFDSPERRTHAIQMLRHALACEEKGELVTSPLAMLGFGVPADPVVDPSTDESLRGLGVAYLTGLIEDLARVDLVSSPAPLMNARGTWMGYKLTDRGRGGRCHPCEPQGSPP